MEDEKIKISLRLTTLDLVFISEFCGAKPGKKHMIV